MIRRLPNAPYPYQTDRRAVMDGPRIPITHIELDEQGFAYERVVQWDYECGCTENSVQFRCSNTTHPQEHPATEVIRTHTDKGR